MFFLVNIRKRFFSHFLFSDFAIQSTTTRVVLFELDEYLQTTKNLSNDIRYFNTLYQSQFLKVKGRVSCILYTQYTFATYSLLSQNEKPPSKS